MRIGIGLGLSFVRAAGAGLLFLDDFDGVALGDDWTNVGSAPLTVSGGRLHLTGQGAAAWGDYVEHTAGFDRLAGRTFLVGMILNDQDTAGHLGWASTTGIADPRTDGYRWKIENGLMDAISAGAGLRLFGTGVTGTELQPMGYLIGVTLNDPAGFVLWASAIPGSDGNPALGREVGYRHPPYPLARVLWRNDADTDALMHPAMGVASPSYGGMHIDFAAVADVPDWSDPDAIAVFVERFLTNGALSAPWTAIGGTLSEWSVASNVLTHTGDGGNVWHPTDSPGDGLWHWKIVVGNSGDIIGGIFRVVDSSNYIRWYVQGGGFLRIDRIVAGADDGLIYSGPPPSWANGSTQRVTIGTIGNRYTIRINDGDPTFGAGWVTDANSRHLTGDGIGVLTNGATSATWDNLIADPAEFTLPTMLQISEDVAPWTVGSTLVSNTFTGANGTALSTYDAGWTSLGGTSDIQSNAAHVTQGAIRNDIAADDYQVTANLVVTTPGDPVRSGFFLRYTDANNHVFMRALRDDVGQPANDEIEVWHTIDGVSSGPVKSQLGVTFWSDGSSHELTAQCLGSRIRWFLDGEPNGELETTLLTGAPGLYIEDANDSGTLIDNFTVNAIS